MTAPYPGRPATTRPWRQPATGRRASLAWLLPALLLAATVHAHAQTAPEFSADPAALPSTAHASPAIAPRVTKLAGQLELDYTIEATVQNLSDWLASHGERRLVPYIDGRPIRGNYPQGIDPEHGRVLFHLTITPESQDAWTTLLGAPEGLRRLVTFSVGPEDGAPFDTVYGRDNRIPLTVISPVYGAIVLLVVLSMLAAFVQLARTTSIIRVAGPLPSDGRLRPYDLGRFQMAFWFFLIYVSYTAIWLITDATDTLTPSLLALMGISAGTALSEAMIDAGKESARNDRKRAFQAERQALSQTVEDLQGRLQAAPAASSDDAMPDALLLERLHACRQRQAEVTQALQAIEPATPTSVSNGFLRDLLADTDGYRFDRFQIFAFTLILGVIFISAVYNSLAMPELSPTLLALMGLSSGTYIGFKFPERA